MSYSARIILDSITPAGARLTTMEVTFPRFVLSEFNTHRVFSRNSASSRAIPIKKRVKAILTDPVEPIHWGKNQRGMSAKVELTGWRLPAAKLVWHACRYAAVGGALLMEKIGLHKQISNRLLEPFLWHTVVVTATEWTNFFHLRRAPDAQPEIHHIADLMYEIYAANTPIPIGLDQWHLPFVVPDERIFDIETLKKVSAGRCARVSYLTHDGKRDIGEDIRLADHLTQDGHWSPTEHVATPLAHRDEWSGNFRGWKQMRKFYPNENLTHASLT